MAEMVFDPEAHERIEAWSEEQLAKSFGLNAGTRAISSAFVDMQPLPHQQQQAKAGVERPELHTADDPLDMSTSPLGVTDEDIFGPQGKLG